MNVDFSIPNLSPSPYTVITPKNRFKWFDVKVIIYSICNKGNKCMLLNRWMYSHIMVAIAVFLLRISVYFRYPLYLVLRIAFSGVEMGQLSFRFVIMALSWSTQTYVRLHKHILCACTHTRTHTHTQSSLEYYGCSCCDDNETFSVDLTTHKKLGQFHKTLHLGIIVRYLNTGTKRPVVLYTVIA